MKERVDLHAPKTWLPLIAVYAQKTVARQHGYMPEHFRHLEYREIAGEGHFLMLEKPDEFNRLLLDFCSLLHASDLFTLTSLIKHEDC